MRKAKRRSVRIVLHMHELVGSKKLKNREKMIRFHLEMKEKT